MKRFMWKKGWTFANKDANVMKKIEDGEITLEEGCELIRDEFDNHPTPEQLEYLMWGLGYHAYSGKC